MSQLRWLFQFTLQMVKSQKLAALHGFSHISLPLSLILIPTIDAYPYFIDEKTRQGISEEEGPGQVIQLARKKTQG